MVDKYTLSYHMNTEKRLQRERMKRLDPLSRKILQMVNKKKVVPLNEITKRFKASPQEINDSIYQLLGNGEFFESRPQEFKSWQ